MKLEPLERALLAEADAEARRLREEAEAAARGRLAKAEAEAGAMVTEARLQSEAVAAVEAARRHAVGRRRARELRLGAQRALVDEVRTRAREAALALRDDPRYPALLEHLERAARGQLGEDAELVVDPPRTGGVIARAGPVRVDYTLPALADRSLEALGDELERLWR